MEPGGQRPKRVAEGGAERAAVRAGCGTANTTRAKRPRHSSASSTSLHSSATTSGRLRNTPGKSCHGMISVILGLCPFSPFCWALSVGFGVSAPLWLLSRTSRNPNEVADASLAQVREAPRSRRSARWISPVFDNAARTGALVGGGAGGVRGGRARGGWSVLCARVDGGGREGERAREGGRQQQSLAL